MEVKKENLCEALHAKVLSLRSLRHENKYFPFVFFFTKLGSLIQCRPFQMQRHLKENPPIQQNHNKFGVNVLHKEEE